jgi:hypothetical protein
MGTLDQRALPTLLYDVIPIFSRLAHTLCNGRPHSKDFHVRFEFHLGVFKLSLLAILCEGPIDDGETSVLEEVAELLEHLVHMTIVSVPHYQPRFHVIFARLPRPQSSGPYHGMRTKLLAY